MTQTTDQLATIDRQCERLIDLGVPELASMNADDLRRLAREAAEQMDAAVGEPTLVVNERLVPAASLASLMTRTGKPGFVVEDMTDLADFTPTEHATVPDSPLYVLHDVTRGDDLLNWTPEEALAEFSTRQRRPLTVNEGISWMLHEPELLEPGLCFMTIGSRKRKPRGFDARTPAIWISGGTGRDGAARRGAPKVGWCWWRNRHTWLGFASAAHVSGAAPTAS
ncbi:DUF5701 family protein [Paramicrobacterium sp. CJ85]|uniref:DUF5701 family protein n=1 Tax=Paramicrobacterium sp. CJ85 TaxID=3445355 RepID=UPI003F643634